MTITPGSAADRLRLLAICLLTLCVLASLIVAGLSLSTSTHALDSAAAQATSNASLIRDLKDQLADVDEQIVAARANNADHLACDAAYTVLVDHAFRVYVLGIGDLVSSAGSPESIAALNALKDTANAAADAQVDYIAAGRILPCPIAVGTP